MITATDRVDNLLTKLATAWTAFHEKYAGLSDEQLLESGVVGAWSIRDLIAHLTWWDEEALTHLPLILAGGRPPRYSVTYGGIDAFNALMTEHKRGLSLAEVHTEAAETHQRLITYLKGLPPEQIMAEPRFRHRLRLDTYGHYPIHTQQILEWRDHRSKTG